MIAAVKSILGIKPRPRFEQLMQERFTPSAAECDLIDAADKEHAKLVALISEYRADRPREDLRALRAQFAAMPSAETAAALEAATQDFPQSEAVNRDLNHRAREACRDHVQRVLIPIASPIFKRAAAQVERRIADLVGEERLVLARHSVEFEPSPLLKALEALRGQLLAAPAAMLHRPRGGLREALAVLFV
jgi:hypothetical protein